MTGNRILNRAKHSSGTDEWYTPYEAVAEELEHYIADLNGKAVYCNCDMPYESAFCNWFLDNFGRIGLKRLVCTAMRADKTGLVLSVESDSRKSPGVSELVGNGDMFSEECLDILRNSDILVTNPPFSLFTKLFRILTDMGKRYLLVCNQNAISYRDVFPELMAGNCWLGYRFGDMSFRVPADTEPRATRFWIDGNGQKWRSLGNVMWLTNAGTRHYRPLQISRTYDPNRYPKYDNFDAVNVSRYADIPVDYDGVMGVPVTYLRYHDPQRFEIIGQANHGTADDRWDLFKPILNGREQFKRILIRRIKGGCCGDAQK